MSQKDYYTVSELAQLLGISRIAVFKKIKKRQIKAIKIGRNFAISKKEIASVTGQTLTTSQKTLINKAVNKTLQEYGQALKMLGDA